MKHLLIGGIAALSIGLTGCSTTGGAGTTTTTSTIPVPTPADFRVEVTVLGKQCFGACFYDYDVTLWPNPGYPPQPNGRTLTVIYSVVGGDQEQVGHFTVTRTNGHGDVTASSPVQ